MGASAKRKEERKRKFSHIQSEKPTTSNTPAPSASVDIDPLSAPNTSSRPSKKPRKRPHDLPNTSGEPNASSKTSDGKSQNQPPSPPLADADAEPSTQADADADVEVDAEAKVKEADADKKPAHRFICFVGNLPYTTTLAALQKHFAPVRPSAIRHRTEREDPTRSRGFAFVEFEHYDRMSTCLSLMHHSPFDDGISPARRINVELTAGGGGSSTQRQAKLKSKNDKLRQERRRKHKEERKQKRRETRARRPHDSPAGAGAGAGDGAPAGAPSDVHPSRLKQMRLS